MTVPVGIGYMLPNVLFPAGAVLHKKIHMLRCSSLVLPPAKQRAVAVADQFGLVGLLDDLLAEVQIRRHAEGPIVPQVELKMILQVRAFGDFAGPDPGFGGIGPETLENTYPIDRLAFENSSDTFLACQFGHHSLHQFVQVGNMVAFTGSAHSNNLPSRRKGSLRWFHTKRPGPRITVHGPGV